RILHTICYRDWSSDVCSSDLDALLATNFLSVKGRVARALLNLAEAFGHDLGQGRVLIRQKVSQSDLAAMAGIARENVSRVLHERSEERRVGKGGGAGGWGGGS